MVAERKMNNWNRARYADAVAPMLIGASVLDKISLGKTLRAGGLPIIRILY